MDLSAIPYLIVSRELDCVLSTERVFLCLCLLDHMVLGVGLSRDEAMRHMVIELEEKYGHGHDGDGFEVDSLSRN